MEGKKEGKKERRKEGTLSFLTVFGYIRYRKKAALGGSRNSKGI